MIDLYYWPTPNGWKITIFCEEAGVPYRVVPVNIGAGDQFKPEFLAISPNNRMPAMVDPEGPGGKPFSLFESGAILDYLADKTGKFLPRDPRGKFTVLQWVYWQMGGLGPMAGQNHHFRMYAPEPIPYAVDRYTKETGRLYAVLDKQLGKGEYVAGDYSIADMAIYPWVLPWERQGMKLEEFKNVERWLATMRARPAVERGVAVGRELRQAAAQLSEEARRNLFGDRQFERR